MRRLTDFEGRSVVVLFLLTLWSCASPECDKGDEGDTSGVATFTEDVAGCPAGGSTWSGSYDYNFEPRNWTCVDDAIAGDFYIDTASFERGGYAASDVQAELAWAFTLAIGVGTRLNLQVTPTETACGIEEDGRNCFLLYPGSKDDYFGTSGDSASATTFPYWSSDAPGETRECDIVYWEESGGSVNSFTFNGPLGTGTQIPLHELGHCLGLEHNTIVQCVAGEFVPLSVMGPGAVSLTSAVPEIDQEALLFLYGTSL